MIVLLPATPSFLYGGNSASLKYFECDKQPLRLFQWLEIQYADIENSRILNQIISLLCASVSLSVRSVSLLPRQSNFISQSGNRSQQI